MYNIRINLQHMHQSIQCKHQSTATHQPVAYASACSTHISLQHTHQSTAYASLCSLHFSLQHTHQSTAIHQSIAHTSVSSPGISLQHTNQLQHKRGCTSTARASACIIGRSLQHTHESTAYTAVYSTHISLQHTHQSTAYTSVWSIRIRNHFLPFSH